MTDTKFIRIHFLCCLDPLGNKTRKYQIESIAEVETCEAAQQIIDNKFAQHSDFGWKVEWSLIEPMAASYSTPVQMYPMTIHKISKDGKKVWASYDNYMADDKAETGYRYDNDKANDPDQWNEYHLKVKNGVRKFVRKGEPFTSWPLLIGVRKFWWNESF